MLNTARQVVDFLFQDLPPPCLVLGQESCHELHDRNGNKIMKSGGGYCPQFLKVMHKVLWGACPSLSRCPSHIRPSPENTLLLDDSPEKCILTPPGNVIFPRSWNPTMPNDMFLFSTVYPYIAKLARSGLTVPEFVLANPIGHPGLARDDPMYKLLYGYAKLNNLIPS